MKSMGGTRSAVEAVGDGIEFVLTVDREVSALWQVLTQQPVSVLTGAALPGTVRIAEVHAHASGGAELLMAGHFLALVVRKALAQGGSDRIQFGSEARQGRGGGGVFHLRQQHQATGALNQHADARLGSGALNEVAFPMAWHHPIVALRRADRGTHHARATPPPVIRPASVAC